MAVMPYDGDDEAVKIANPRKFVRSGRIRRPALDS
jgi:hypothetical protein